MEGKQEDKRFKKIKKPRERRDKETSLRKKARSRKGRFAGIRRYESKETDAVETEVENEIEVMQEVDDEVPSTSRNNDTSTLSVSVMERKCVEPVVTTPIKNMTRKRSRESAIFTEDVCSPIDGYKIIDSPVLVKMVNCAAKCSYCGAEKSIFLKQDKKRVM